LSLVELLACSLTQRGLTATVVGQST